MPLMEANGSAMKVVSVAEHLPTGRIEGRKEVSR